MVQTAIVTGASRGIGRACALKLSEKFNVIINYNNNKSCAEDIRDEILKNGGVCEIVKADVSNPKECEMLAQKAKDLYGSADVLVNNAGISEQKVFSDISFDDWNKMININLTGVYNMIKAVLPFMINKKRGKIVNISSVWGLCGASCEVHYSAAKAGIIGLTKALAKEVGPSNINVNAVAPGAIHTDMCAFDEETEKLVASDIALARFGEPYEVAEAVNFLCSRESDYITGEVINVSGGYVI